MLSSQCPSKTDKDPISATQSIPPQNPTEGSVPWQANIQGIQNRMGVNSNDYGPVLILYLYLFLINRLFFALLTSVKRVEQAKLETGRAKCMDARERRMEWG